MNTLPFPLWIYVNVHARPKDGFPCYVLTRGGPPTPFPASFPVYTTKEKAQAISPGYPFECRAVDEDSFFEIIRECHDLDDVIIDMGTPDAAIHRIETILAERDGSTHS